MTGKHEARHGGETRHGREARPSRETKRADAQDGRRGKWGWLRTVLMILLALVFVGSGAKLLITQMQYRASDKLYSSAASRFTVAVTPAPASSSSGGQAHAQSGGNGSGDAAEASDVECAPISVDFEALREVNPEVIGWIYCEGTQINYPVVQASDNDAYLHRSFDGTYNPSGSIFAEAENRPGFADANTILYGHHMRNGSMFAGLEAWADPAYAAAHPVLWILTPECDYKVYLFAGYITDARSSVYSVYPEYGVDVAEYVQAAREASDFPAPDVPEAEKYVLLSTCAYTFDYARYVVHGAMVPLSGTEENGEG